MTCESKIKDLTKYTLRTVQTLMNSRRIAASKKTQEVERNYYSESLKWEINFSEKYNQQQGIKTLQVWRRRKKRKIKQIKRLVQIFNINE